MVLALGSPLPGPHGQWRTIVWSRQSIGGAQYCLQWRIYGGGGLGGLNPPPPWAAKKKKKINVHRKTPS